jgi:hypothetical protein
MQRRRRMDVAWMAMMMLMGMSGMFVHDEML